MTIQELEQQLLDLDFNHRIHLLQVLAQSLSIAQPQAQAQPLDSSSEHNLLNRSTGLK